jgi:hypothetical protein
MSWNLKRGRPGEYIHHIDDLPPGQPVVIVARVSTCTQNHAGNLSIQLCALREAVARRGGVVVYDYQEVVSGFDPNWLSQPALIAQDRSAVIVAETVDRLMRPSTYYSVTKPYARLAVMDLEMLERAAFWVPLYTVVHPDSTPGENRAAQTKRGQAAKAKGGRPIVGRTKFRERWLPVAVEMHSSGMSLRTIAAEITRMAGRRITHYRRPQLANRRVVRVETFGAVHCPRRCQTRAQSAGR